MSEDGDASPVTSAGSPRRSGEREAHSRRSLPTDGVVPAADRILLKRIRAGDPDAGNEFVQDHYPGVYRYLLYLTGSPEAAEDLTQETFLQAWRRLESFEGRAALRTWLHRIAHRELLQAVRRQHLIPGCSLAMGKQAAVSLEAVSEIPEPYSSGVTETIDLRVIIGTLPLEERRVVVLHYLEGYQHEEVAQILGIPLRRIRQRLAAARGRLQQALAEGDLFYLNEPSWPMRHWAWLPLDQMYALATRVIRPGAADRGAPWSGATTKENMERREFLRHAAVSAAGLMLPEAEKEVVDSRLSQKVTLAFKGPALSDLCGNLCTETGVHLSAGPSIADEKVTLFCKQMPLRDVMRQLSHPFGYAWLRSGTPGAYRYELVQDLRSQLLDEELRNHDQNAALLALDREMQRYRKYLGLSPDEVWVVAATALPEEKELLLRYGGLGWGLIQLYFRLSPNDLNRLRGGQGVVFSAEPEGDQQPLPPDLEHGILQSQRDRRIFQADGRFHLGNARNRPDGRLLAAVPEARAMVVLRIEQSELGQFTYGGGPGVFISRNSSTPGAFQVFGGADGLAVGMSPAVLEPRNAEANAKLAHDPALLRSVTIEPKASCGGQGGGVDDPQATTADVLEALHRATGFPIIADFYTRLYLVSEVTARNVSVFDALNRLCDRMRLRWRRDGGWLQLRSTSYFHDRLKEVPNRLLARWAASRRQHGALALDDLVEIAQLSDAQLDGSSMGEGARLCWGLEEWIVPRVPYVRAQLRYLAEFTPAQRQQAQTAAGLPFSQMTLSQQQGYLARALRPDQQVHLENLGGATLHVDYTLPGWFRWAPPGRAFRPSPVRERTPEAALQAARRLDPGANASRIEPTRLDATFLFTADPSSKVVRITRRTDDGWLESP